MPFILKKPTNTPDGLSKGILIFTHKERPYLQPDIFGLSQRMSALKKYYVLGMHWGSPHTHVPMVPFIDFHLGGQGTLSLAEDNSAPHIKLCSRNFLPPCFHPDNSVPTEWDILAVAGPRRLKHLDELLVVLRQLYDQRPDTKTLIISACDKLVERDPVLDYVEIQADYERLFTEEERQNLVLMLLEADGGVAFTQEQLAKYYQASKIFTLFTNKEGESRVISEALCCGVPVVVKNTLEGGGRDYLDETNSRQFGTLDEAVCCFTELMDNEAARHFDVDAMLKAQSELYTAQTLTDEMAQLFASMGLLFAGEMDTSHLSFKLPSHHYKTLPRAWRGEYSNDLASPWAASLFISSLLAQVGQPQFEVGLIEAWQLKLYGSFQSFSKQARSFLKRPGQWLRQRGVLPKKSVKRATMALLSN